MKRYVIVMLLALGFSFAANAQAPAEDDSAGELIGRIEELSQQGKYKEAIPLAEKLVVLTRRAKGDEDPDTATSLNNLAALYEDMGEYAKAEPLFKEALEIHQKIFGREHPDTATNLNNLAELYWAMGEYAKAKPLYEEALGICRKVFGREHPNTATSLNNLGTLYKDMGDYPKAEPLYKEALEIRLKVLGREHPDTAESLNSLAELYRVMGDYAKAEPLYKEALEIRLKVLGREHPDTAESLNNLAALYRAMGDYPKAEPLLKEALEIHQKVFGREHPSTATNLDNLATLYQAMGDYPKAEPLLKEALEIRQKVFGRQQSVTSGSLNNLAALYQAMGDYPKAEPLFKEALEIRQKVLGRQHPDTGSSLNNLATLYQAMGDYAKAEPLFKEALEISLKVFGRERPDTATSLSNLAALYEEMGDYAKAEPLFKEALETRQKVFGREHPDTAMGLNNLGELYRVMGEYAKAEPLFKEALEIRQKVLGREHSVTSGSLNNLAGLYEDMGDYARAEPLYKEALEIRQKVLGREHPFTAISLNNLALLYTEEGDLAKAEPLYEEALEIFQKVLGGEHPLTATSLNNLAYLELDLGKVQEAKRLGQLGYAAGVKAFSQILSFGSEDQRLAYQRLQDPYTLFAVLGENDPFLAGAVLHHKGVVLDSIIEDRLLAETGKDEANRELVDQLNAKKGMVAQLSLQTTAASPKEASESIQVLEQEVENIEGELARQGTDLGQARRALSIRVEDVKGALPNDTVLVEYVRYSHYLGKSKFESHYGAIVLSAVAPPRWVALGSARDIDAALKRYQRLVRKASDDEIAAILRKVYNEVWEPVEQTFPTGTNRVVVSPDGELNFLSFATLLDREKGFVAEKYLIQYVTSGRDLLREPQPTLSKQVIVMANPKFDRHIQLASDDPPSEDSSVLRGAEKRDIEDLSFEELGGTEKESAQLLLKFGHWGWQAGSFSGSDVNKRALLYLHSPYILHLATHGFFEPEDSSSEANQNEFQSPGVKSDLTKSRFFKNPMHRSGLALAGANTTIAAWKRGEAPPIEEDGILTAEDVSTLDLKGTWLVTLSACDTGSGEARAGEGVMGLRRGFVEAGAQNLLMSLWPISDEFTVQIMSDFYESAHQSGNAPEALAKVQRDWLVKLRKEQGLASAVNLAGPFIMSSQGRP
jgi:tetratricopeptide (TPR) repeat protein